MEGFGKDQYFGKFFLNFMLRIDSGQELEVKSKAELMQGEPEFHKKFYTMYSWDPNWPNCHEFGYPSCKKINIEKWKSIAIEEN